MANQHGVPMLNPPRVPHCSKERTVSGSNGYAIWWDCGFCGVRLVTKNKKTGALTYYHQPPCARSDTRHLYDVASDPPMMYASSVAAAMAVPPMYQGDAMTPLATGLAHVRLPAPDLGLLQSEAASSACQMPIPVPIQDPLITLVARPSQSPAVAKDSETSRDELKELKSKTEEMHKQLKELTEARRTSPSNKAPKNSSEPSDPKAEVNKLFETTLDLISEVATKLNVDKSLVMQELGRRMGTNISTEDSMTMPWVDVGSTMLPSNAQQLSKESLQDKVPGPEIDLLEFHTGKMREILHKYNADLLQHVVPRRT